MDVNDVSVRESQRRPAGVEACAATVDVERLASIDAVIALGAAEVFDPPPWLAIAPDGQHQDENHRNKESRAREGLFRR